MNSVLVDDWTAECAIIASNDITQISDMTCVECLPAVSCADFVKLEFSQWYFLTDFYFFAGCPLKFHFSDIVSVYKK